MAGKRPQCGEGGAGLGIQPPLLCRWTRTKREPEMTRPDAEQMGG